MYQYPATFFQNLMNVNFLLISTNTKSDRLKVLKILVDKLINNEIDIHLYHFGLYLLNPYAGARQKEEDAKAAGKRRSDFMDTLPLYELKDNDSFISEVWSGLIERRYPDVGKEIVRVPPFNEIRILFTPNQYQFGNHTGLYYSDADWLEPVPSYELKVKRWVGEKDPMIPQSKKEGVIEGSITLGHSGEGGLRHFVGREPVYAGSYIEIKFGDGWIPGRYEWSFEQGNPIRIHSSRHRIPCCKLICLVKVKESHNCYLSIYQPISICSFGLRLHIDTLSLLQNNEYLSPLCSSNLLRFLH